MMHSAGLRSLIKLNGFTLIELMIVVAIIGILAAVATPIYTNTIAVGYRADAQRELIHIVNLQEAYFADNFTYVDDLKLLGLNASPYITESGLYKIDQVFDSDFQNRYRMRATAIGAQESNDQNCKKLIINQLGEKIAFSADNVRTDKACWH